MKSDNRLERAKVLRVLCIKVHAERIVLVDYEMIAAAAGAWSGDVKDLESGIKEAIEVVQGGRSAVLNVFVRD